MVIILFVVFNSIHRLRYQMTFKWGRENLSDSSFLLENKQHFGDKLEIEKKQICKSLFQVSQGFEIALKYSKGKLIRVNTDKSFRKSF